MEITVWTILIASTITAVATGLGALPFFFVKEISPRWISLSNAIAAGLMLGASQSLIMEGISYQVGSVFFGFALGLGFLIVTSRLLENHHHLHFDELKGANAMKVILILGVMTIHSFSEGVGVGVAFGGRDNLGELISLAIAVHNIPEGLAICVVLIPRGMAPWKGMLWSIFSSLPQPLMAIPAFLFVTAFETVLPVGLGFAAGAMIRMVFAEIFPDALENASRKAVAFTTAVSLAAMLLFQFWING